MSGGLIGPEYDRQIRETIIEVRRGRRTSVEHDGNPEHKKTTKFTPKHGQLLEDLEAADNHMDPPKTARCRILGKKADDSLSESEIVVTVANRLGVSYSAGDYVRLRFLCGEWTVQRDGAGGGHGIDFTVVDVYCPEDYDNEEGGEFYVTARVDWYSHSCSDAPPGFDEYTNTVRIFDSCVMAYYTRESLGGLDGHTAKKGYATWAYPFRADGYPSECKGRWICRSICGEPTCGATVSPPGGS